MGALYKDTSNYELVQKFIIQSIEDTIDFSELILHDTNYKDQLSRYIKKTYDKYPEYKTVEVENRHKTEIYNGPDLIGESTHVDKKQSQQEGSS